MPKLLYFGGSQVIKAYFRCHGISMWDGITIKLRQRPDWCVILQIKQIIYNELPKTIVVHYCLRHSISVIHVRPNMRDVYNGFLLNK